MGLVRSRGEGGGDKGIILGGWRVAYLSAMRAAAREEGQYPR